MLTFFRFLYICWIYVKLLKTDTIFTKFEKASLTVWSLTYTGRNIVTKIGSFSFLRGPGRCFQKLRIISLSPKRFLPCRFCFKKPNKEEILCEVHISVTPLVSRIRKKYPIPGTFLGVLLGRINVQVEISSLLEQRVPPLEPRSSSRAQGGVFPRSQAL